MQEELWENGNSNTIINAYNTADVSTTSWVTGGIIGYYNGENNYIYNSYNIGNISAGNSWVSYSVANGIGNIGTNGKIANCYNIGKLKGNGWTGNCVIGTGSSGNDENCYYLRGVETENNCVVDKNAISFLLEKCDEVVENLNKYIDENSTNEEIHIDLWKKWKVGEDGYPTFE